MPIVSLGSADLTPACSYTLVYNVLHFPAGVVPVTTVRGDEQVREVCQPWCPVVVRLDLACSLLWCCRSVLFAPPLICSRTSLPTVSRTCLRRQLRRFVKAQRGCLSVCRWPRCRTSTLPLFYHVFTSVLSLSLHC